MSGNFSNNTSHQDFSLIQCLLSKSASNLFLAYNLTYAILLLPLCSFILHHGVQQWRKRSSSSSALTISHSHIFLYHMAVLELVAVVGCCFLLFGIYRELRDLLTIGHKFVIVVWYGETLFHTLTGVERYLAVVHPITYLSLRTERGARIRNVSIVSTWLTSVLSAIIDLSEAALAFSNLCFFSTCLAIISFCSVSVLCVLIRPGPGNQGRDIERRDQSKQKAFYIIVAVLVALGLRFSGILMSSFVYFLRANQNCLLSGGPVWFNLPCSMVLPLLFLHREGKSFCSKTSRERAIRAVFHK